MLLAGILRLYRFDSPIADWHSWRQSDTSAVSKIFITEGIDLLHPRYFDISNIQSGFDNPEGLRMVEFPLFNLIHAVLYMTFGVFTIEQWGRLTTIIFSLLATLFIGLITSKYVNKRSGLFASFFYAALPFSVFYGRSILPDTAMIASVLGAIYFFSVWIDSVGQKSKTAMFRTSMFLLAFVFAVASLLFKPYALFFLLPIGVLAIEKFKFGVVKQWPLWIFAAGSIIPLVLWRMWITNFPEGIPVSAWLFNAGNIRFKGAYFYWLFGERISQLILGYYTIFAVLGVFKKIGEKHFYFFLSFIVASLAYMTVIARGNVQHDYYQIAIIPSLAILIGRGLDFLLSFKERENKILAVIVSICVTFLMFSLSWYHVRDFFNVNNIAIVEVGKRADAILPKNARVIAPYDGDTTFLYYVNRPGWPAFQASAEELKQKGATHMILLSPNPETIEDLTSKHTVIEHKPEYIIVAL